jgi:hypothetical protein
LWSAVLGRTPAWVFNREQGPVQPTLLTSACACVAAFAKIRLGNNMVPLSPFMHGVLGRAWMTCILPATSSTAL